MKCFFGRLLYNFFFQFLEFAKLRKFGSVSILDSPPPRKLFIKSHFYIFFKFETHEILFHKKVNGNRLELIDGTMEVK